MAESQATLDRGYCKPVQSIDTNITEDGGPARYYAEVPKKAESTEAWLADLRQDERRQDEQKPTH
jgi:hypothetical protein